MLGVVMCNLNNTLVDCLKTLGVLNICMYLISEFDILFTKHMTLLYQNVFHV